MERLFEGASAMRLDGAALVDESFLADSCAMADSRFDAVAFAENVPLRDWASVFPNGRRSTHDVHAPLDGDGEVFAYPFGALVFRDVSAARREEVLAKVRQGFPQLSPPPIWEQFTVREDPAAKPGMAGGALVLDRLTEDRAGVVAHTVAQSAALEYYERIVEARRPSRAQWHGVAADPAAAPFHRRRRQRAQRSARGVTPLGQAGRDVG